MDKRINKKTRVFFQKFKDDIKEELLKQPFYKEYEKNIVELLQYIYDYQPLELTKIDFQKRKRVKNIVPIKSPTLAEKAKPVS